jgi:polypyrimidine tract-binding protein 1
MQSTMNTIQSAKQIKEAAITGGDGFVIKALITNIVYPICIDALYQVFSKYGNVLKIVLIQKNELGALIQMKDEMQVQGAMNALNGRNMYNTYTGGCNILNLQLSRHKSIEVKANNNRSWDYTNPILTVGEPNRMNQNQNDNKNLISDHPLLPMPMNMAAAAAAAAAQHVHHYNPQSNNMYLTHNQQHQAQQNQNQLQPGGHFQNSNSISAQSVTGYPIQTMDNRPAVVQVSNFPDQIANPDALFTLFGVYGDILKVKIMYNRRDNALMQFKSYEQALNAVSKMDKVKLFEKIISVGMSKFPEIQIPIKNDGGLAKDYSTSPLHRFKKPGSKNFFNIFAPNLTLHLSNISQGTSQEQIQELFTKHGTVNNFKWISKEGNKMALIELSSLEEAVLALIDLHNYQLNGSYLRVNFAK